MEENLNISQSYPPQPKKKSGIRKKILIIILALLALSGVAYGTYYFTKQQAEEDAAAVIEPLQAQVAELEATRGRTWQSRLDAWGATWLKQVLSNRQRSAVRQ